MNKIRRTMLFMPGNNPAMLINADVLGADSIILDLEDAVSIDEKDSARILVREALKFLSYKGVETVVRINPLDTDFGLKDIEEMKSLKFHTILLPKADYEEVKLADKLLKGTDKNIMPLIETSIGLEQVYETITASDRVDGVLLGGEDLTTDMGVKRTKIGKEIYYARCRVIAAAKAAKISAIDTPFTDTDDFEGLRLDSALAKELGMTGKAVINPRGIDVVKNIFSPSLDEIEKSKRIMAEYEKAKARGLGVFSLDGKMIDAPILTRAKKLVETAGYLGLLEVEK